MSGAPIMQRHDVIAERRERQRHDRQEHHDRAVHRAEGIVEVGRHAPLWRRPAPSSLSSSGPTSGIAWPGCAICQRIIIIRQKAEQQKTQRRQAVLNADDLVIGRENVRAPEAGFSGGARRAQRVRQRAGRCQLSPAFVRVVKCCSDPFSSGFQCVLSNTSSVSSSGRYRMESEEQLPRPRHGQLPRKPQGKPEEHTAEHQRAGQIRSAPPGATRTGTD